MAGVRVARGDGWDEAVECDVAEFGPASLQKPRVFTMISFMISRVPPPMG